MQALAAVGNASGMRRALAQCHRVLAAEGMAPSPEMEQLASRLLAR